MEAGSSSDSILDQSQGAASDRIDDIAAEYLEDETTPEGEEGNRIRVGVTRKKQFRWSDPKDLVLVCEVENLQPVIHDTRKAAEIWKTIASNINRKYGSALDYIGVQRRFSKISKDFKDEDKKNRYMSGTEETITALKEKLTSLTTLMDDFKEVQKSVNEKRQKKVDEDKAAAEEIRGSAFETYKRKGSEAGPPAKRVSDSSLIDLWTMKQAADQQHHDEILNSEREFKLKKFTFKEQQQELEKAKFEHQKRMEEEELKLKKEEFDLGREERKTQLDTQKMLLEILAKKL